MTELCWEVDVIHQEINKYFDGVINICFVGLFLLYLWGHLHVILNKYINCYLKPLNIFKYSIVFITFVTKYGWYMIVSWSARYESS